MHVQPLAPALLGPHFGSPHLSPAPHPTLTHRPIGLELNPATLSLLRSGPQRAHMLWALALLRCRPPAGWLDMQLQHMAPALPTLPQRELTASIWALARLGHAPPHAWMDACLQQAFGRMLGAESTTIANVLFCVASLDMAYLQVGGGVLHCTMRIRGLGTIEAGTCKSLHQR